MKLASPKSWKRIRARGPLPALPLEAVFAAWRFLRRQCLRLHLKYVYGMRIGKRCFIGNGIRFVYPRNVTVEDGVSIGREVELWSESSTGKLTVERGSQVSRGCKLDYATSWQASLRRSSCRQRVVVATCWT